MKSEGRSIVIRAPNHLGDFVMALPALHAGRPDAVMLPRWLAPLAELAGFATLPFDRGVHGFTTAVAALRRGRFERGVLLTPSFSSAALFFLGGVRERRGTDTDARTVLLNAPVDRRLLALNHRTSVYMLLATGDLPGVRPTPTLQVPATLRADFRAMIGTSEPLVGIFPGSNARSRRWDADRFAAVARELRDAGRVVVFGSVAERALTGVVAGAAAIDLAGRTDLPLLAAGLAECRLLVSNDSGPLHLAAAVGTRTVSLWGAGDPARTGPPPDHRLLRHTELPCLECVKNQCPRSGKGYILPDAYNECLKLIQVTDVVSAANAALAGET